MEWRTALIAASILLIVSSASLTGAAWTYHKKIGTITGVLKPGGFEEFTVDLGEIYAGEEKVQNATIMAHIPVEANVTFYAEANETIEWSIKVFRDNELVGTINSTNNVTEIVSKGAYEYTFEIHVKAPVDLEEPIPFKIEVYALCEEVEE